MDRTPNTYNPAEVRRAFAKLNTNVDGVTQIAVGNWNATTAVVDAGAANWNTAYSRKLGYDSDFKCLTSIF